MSMKASRSLLAFLLIALSPGLAPYELFAQQVIQTGITAVQPPRVGPAASGGNAVGGSLDFSLKMIPSMTAALPGVKAAPKVDPRQMEIPWVHAVVELSQPVGLAGPAVENQPADQPQVAAKETLLQAQTILAAEGPKEGEQPISGFKARWDRFWSAGPKAKTKSEVQGSEGSEAPRLAPHQAKSAAPQTPKVPNPLRAIGVAAAAAPAAEWVSRIFPQIKPYAEGAAILAGTYAANSAVGWAIKKAGQRFNWDPNTTVMVRLAGAALTWSAGIFTGLHMAGVSTHALLTGFGIGGVAISMAAKDFIGNVIEGMKVLLIQPFRIGERIKIGDSVYTVTDMSLRYLDLVKDDGSVTKMLYTQLDDKPITIFREYTTQSAGPALRKVSFIETLKLIKQTTLANFGKSTLWLALGVALLPALAWIKAAVGLGALAGAMPYIKGSLVLLTTRAVENWISTLVSLFAEKNAWSRQTTVVLKLLLQVAAYAVGGGVALSLFGVSGTALIASFGATSIAIGWAASDIFSNMIQGIWILLSRPFKIGNTIEVGGNKGMVMDMTLNYVIIKTVDGSYTLIPYSLLKTSPLTVFPPTAAR